MSVQLGLEIKVSGFSSEARGFAPEYTLRVCLAHEDERSDGGRTALLETCEQKLSCCVTEGNCAAHQNSDKPECPSPALVLCEKSADDRTKDLHTIQYLIVRGDRGEPTGPRRGPSPNKAAAIPRFSTWIQSAMVPPPMVSGAAPAKPEMKRKTINWLMFLLRAQPTRKATKITLQV